MVASQRTDLLGSAATAASTVRPTSNDPVAITVQADATKRTFHSDKKKAKLFCQIYADISRVPRRREDAAIRLGANAGTQRSYQR